jgi:formylglycine-generating enzyme required for sulfatase activity
MRSWAAPCSARLPSGPSIIRRDGLAQLFGECWQWTASSYGTHPGYRQAAGAAGEYNRKFMVNQQVLRGSSADTPTGHAHQLPEFLAAVSYLAVQRRAACS